MEFRQLKYFLAVAEELNFHRAADRVHITQPALSRQISQLEQDLGAVLLLRSNRKVELTLAGREFLERATRIVADVERAKLAAQRSVAGQVGLLVVGYIPSAAHVVVPQILKYCREFFPNVEVDLRSMLSQHQFDALLSQKIDIGILRPWRRIKGLATRHILSEPFVVAVPKDHPLAGKRDVPLQAFAAEQFIMHARQIPGISLTYDLISRLFEDAGFQPQVALESPEEVHLTLGMVRAGFGLSLVSRSTMLFPMAGIDYVEIREQSRPSEVVLGWRQDHDDLRIPELAARIADSLERDLEQYVKASRAGNASWAS